MSTGRIFLYHKKDKIPASCKVYCCPNHRKEIIKEWGKLYAAAFKNCFLQISPDIKEESGKIKVERQLVRNKKPPPYIQTVRMKTINKTPFDNKPLYDYDEK